MFFKVWLRDHVHEDHLRRAWSSDLLIPWQGYSVLLAMRLWNLLFCKYPRSLLDSPNSENYSCNPTSSFLRCEITCLGVLIISFSYPDPESFVRFWFLDDLTIRMQMLVIGSRLLVKEQITGEWGNRKPLWSCPQLTIHIGCVCLGLFTSTSYTR